MSALQWPPDLNPDEIQRLTALNHCLFLDNQDTLWLRCGPDTALFVPAPLRLAILCQLIRSNSDSKDLDSLSKKLIKASYVWPNCREHIREHLRTCRVCQSASTRTPPPITPNDEVTMDIFGPIPSYDNNKFQVVLRDRATGYTSSHPRRTNRPPPWLKSSSTSGSASLWFP